MGLVEDQRVAAKGEVMVVAKLKKFKYSRLQELVLWQTLQSRHRALLASSRRQEALARHEEFMARSESYRESIRLGERRLENFRGDQTEIRGLRWWVPAEEGGGSAFRDRILNRGMLPLSEILDSRGVTVGTAAIDIGANVGTTCIPRVILGDFQYIYAAEPEQANYAALVQNIVANGLLGWVLPDRVAIGSYDGEASLVVHPLIAEHALTLEQTNGSSDGVGRKVVRVPCLTLDSWVAAVSIDLDLVTYIKCDTQGWEGYIFRGARDALTRKHIVWQIEFWPFGLSQAHFALEEMFARIRDNFTHFINLDPKGRGEPSQIRRTSDLPSAVAYLEAFPRSFTNLLLYNAAGP